MKPIYRLLTELSSRKWISRLAGWVAKSRISKSWIPHFAKAYQINLEEAEKEISEYPHLNAFFSRRLKSGIRPIDSSPESIICPVDAEITGIGKIDAGTILNVKGQSYSLHHMLMDTQRERVYQNGHFIVLYLSPTDYHRIHTPIAGEIIGQVHRPGKVYPVNEFGLTQMKQVLVRNERLITYIRHPHTEVAIVKVGALNVASIQLSDRLTSDHVNKGDELAYFEFGSTVVLFVQGNTFQFDPDLKEGDRLRFGERLGKMTEEKGGEG